jgi:two-component system, chemotaxis family, chemotaxis protein CheY
MRSLQEIRVLVVGWKPNTNQFMRDALASLEMPSFTRAPRTDVALELLRNHGYEAVFCTGQCEPLSPAEFATAVRHDALSRDPTVPLIFFGTGLTINEIAIMRDAGIDDIICPPMSIDIIRKRLARVLLQNRRFVVTKGFVGPDRRRQVDLDFNGTEKRQSTNQIFHQSPRVKAE